MLSAGYTQAKDAHVRVDILYSRFSEKGKAFVNLFGSLFFLIPFCCLVIWTSIPLVESAFRISEGSPDPGGLPHRFIVRSAIPLGFALLLVQAFIGLASDLKLIFSRQGADV